MSHPISIAILTPCRGGFSAAYVRCLMDLSHALSRNAIPHEWMPAMDMPVTYARNLLAAQFLASPYTHGLWIDADVHIPPEAVRDMLALQVDFASVACAVRAREGTCSVDDGSTAIELTDLDQEPRRGAVRVDRVGFGVVLTTHTCIDRVAAAHPELRFALGPKNPAVAVFTETIADATLVSGKPVREFQTEDFSFCDRWRALGGEIWTLLDAASEHAGLRRHLRDDVWRRRDELKAYRDRVRETADAVAAEVAALRFHAPEGLISEAELYLGKPGWVISSPSVQHFVQRGDEILHRLRQARSDTGGAVSMTQAAARAS